MSSASDPKAIRRILPTGTNHLHQNPVLPGRRVLLRHVVGLCGRKAFQHEYMDHDNTWAVQTVFADSSQASWLSTHANWSEAEVPFSRLYLD
jgi:hypothetical protein